jgi:DNA-binding NtrC family response regulator
MASEMSSGGEPGLALSGLGEWRAERNHQDAEGPLAEAYDRLNRSEVGTAVSLRDWLDVAERWRILRALRECRGNRSEAARRLGIGRRTLYSKMERLRIQDRV